MTAILTSRITSTEAATWYNLVLLGVIGGIGAMILSESIKDKTQVPFRTIAVWGGVSAIVTLASVLAISKSAK